MPGGKAHAHAAADFARTGRWAVARASAIGARVKGFAERKTQLAAICAGCTLLVLALDLGPTFQQLTESSGVVRAVHSVAGRPGVSVLRALGAIGGFIGAPLQRWELRARDFLARHGAKAQVDSRLVFLGIDNESVSLDPLDFDTLFAGVPRDSADFRALSLMGGGWPWSREIYAHVTDKLLAAGASAVVFDLLFPKPSPDAAADAAFRAALDRHAGRVIIGSNFDPPAIGEGGAGWAHAPPTETLIPQTSPLDARIAYVNFWADEVDGIVRHARFRLTENNLAGFPSRADSEVFESLAYRAVKCAGFATAAGPAVDADYFFRYTGAPRGVFLPRPLFQIFGPQYWERNFDNGERVRGKIVVIGPYGDWQHDEHQTPFGKMPGPEIHLNAMNALLQNAFLRETPRWVDAVIIVAIGVIAWMSALFSPRPVFEVLRVFGLNAVLLLGVLAAFNLPNFFVPILAPVLALNLCGGSCFVFEAVREAMARRKTRRLLERYVGRDVAHELLDQRESILHSLGGQRKTITVLFSDVRGFTTLTESADDPVALVNQLNEYLDRMVRIVFANGGTLDKFIGDGLMAHWGSIVQRGAETDARNAVRAALEMRTALAELNVAWLARGWKPLSFGIGINTGDAIVGNVGCDEKMEVSVIGDPVNLASRIEGATKEYHLDLLLGDETARLVRDAFVLRSIDLLQVKGKTRPTGVFTVAGANADSPPPVWLDDYEQGVRLFRGREFVAAAESFTSAADSMPGDWLVQEYQRRCAVFLETPPPDDWTGVYVMTTK